MIKKPKLVSSNSGLEVNNLRKSLSGKQILRNITMKVEKGKVIGFLVQMEQEKVRPYIVLWVLLDAIVVK